MDNIVLYGHAGSGNHGCEALVRTTYEIFRRAGYREDLTVSTLDAPRDKEYGVPAEQLIQNDFSYRVGIPYRVLAKIHPNCLGIQNRKARKDYRPFLNFVKENTEDTLYVSIGGDNYCTRRPTWLYELNQAIDRMGKKRILWGCSVEPATISEQMVQDLNGYDLIVARETITYEELKRRCRTKVVLNADPAFTLEPEETELPAGFIRGETVGINISPVVMRSESVPGMTMESYKALIRYILANTQLQVALVPHVVIPEDNDMEPLTMLYDEFRNSGRVVLIPDANCRKLKYIISQCCMFIGARTHSTIAAYSTYVPTVVVGYSVKARGIATDIFGTSENYVKPVQMLSSADELIESYRWLSQNQESIRAKLADMMPQYIQSAWEAGTLVDEYGLGGE